jgi:2-dehydro-3-deoxy-D-arabinonate dehydratase
MYLTRHETPGGPRWALNGRWLPHQITLGRLLEIPTGAMIDLLHQPADAEVADEPLFAPVEPMQEIWASGVTYLRSRDARMAESTTADVYDKVYGAERPELFLKALGWRAQGHGQPVRIRKDSTWDVPEPELVVVFNRQLEIVGYTAGNDVSSRSIEGENPLYLPQAKVFDASCAIGPGIVLAAADTLANIPISLTISRGGAAVFEGSTSTAQMKRRLEELVSYLGRELEFPQGGLLMTGTGIVPPESFTLQPGDSVTIVVGECTLVNEVTR